MCMRALGSVLVGFLMGFYTFNLRLYTTRLLLAFLAVVHQLCLNTYMYSRYSSLMFH